MADKPIRTLLLANRPPYPLDDGWKVRTFNVLRAAADIGPVTLAVGSSGLDAVRGDLLRAVGERLSIVDLPLPTRKNSPAKLVAGLLGRWPIQVHNLWDERAQSALDQVTARGAFDVAIASSALMVPYLQRLHRAVPVVIDTHNIDSVNLARYGDAMPVSPRRWYTRVTARRLENFEREVFPLARQVWVCSDLEIPLAEVRGRTTVVKSVPNGVDTGWFKPPASNARQARSLVFFGRLDYYPNREAVHRFVRDILPRIRIRVPDVTFEIVGAGAEPETVALGAPGSGITVRGRVDDVRPILWRAGCSVVPLRAGGGTRLKILEALAAGLPVVSTSLGAEGLGMESARELLIADTDAAFASAVSSVLLDQVDHEGMAATGLSAVRDRFDWHGIRLRMAELIRGVVSDPSGSRPGQ